MKAITVLAAVLAMSSTAVMAGEEKKKVVKEIHEDVEVLVEVKGKDGAERKTKIIVNGEEIDPNDKEALANLPKGTRIMIEKAESGEVMEWTAGDKERHHKVIELKMAGEDARYEAAMRLIQDGNFTKEQRKKLIKELKKQG